MITVRPVDAMNESVSNGKRAAFEILIGRILRSGVVISTVLLIVGLFWHWRATGQVSFDYRIERMDFYEFLFTEARELGKGAFRPRLLVSLGIATLLLTPYLRVFASIVYFGVVDRDLKYTIFTAFVFGVLTYSLLLR